MLEPAAQKDLLCQHEGQAPSVYHWLMSIIVRQIDSLSWQHNYIFTCMLAVIAVQVFVCVCVHASMYFCISFASLHYTPLLPADASKAPCPLAPDEPETSARG